MSVCLIIICCNGLFPAARRRPTISTVAQAERRRSSTSSLCRRCRRVAGTRRAHAAACRRLARAASYGSSTPQSVAMSKSQPPSRRGTISGAPTGSYAIRSAPLSGSRRLKPIGYGAAVKLWESVDKLLGCGRTRACSSLDVESLNDFFVDKVLSAVTLARPST